MIRSVGVFEIDVWEPFPRWITVKKHNEEIKFHLADARDLHYALGAMLDDYKHELLQYAK